MTDSDKRPEFSKYYKTISPTDINIDKEGIFYRDKYNEIINYIKIIITESEDLELYKYFNPKGLLLINTNSGTDILDFLKLISNNYYLNYVEFDFLEISKSPENFIEHFSNIITSFYSREKEEDASEGNDIIKKLVVINNQRRFRDLLNGRSLLKDFLTLLDSDSIDFSSNLKNIIIVWLNYDYNEIEEQSSVIFNLFDLFIKIPLLNMSERETILRNFSEKNPKISFDINTVVNYTDNWEVKDIDQLLKTAIFKHFLNADLNETSNEVTDKIINLIESGEYIPSKNGKLSSIEQKEENLKNQNQNGIDFISKSHEDKQRKLEDVNDLIDSIRDERYSEFMLNQLYESAASKNFNELLVIIDKLNKNESIEENDRKIIAKYPFILNDAPNLAQINLEKAKKRIDLIKQALGK